MKWIKELFKKIKDKEQGAVVVEATIALSVFVFTLYIILSVVDICYTQAKIGIAINSAAKEMSQYAYLYDAFGMDEYFGTENKGKSSEMMEHFSTFLDSISANTADFSADISAAFKQGSEQAANDSLTEYGKNLIGMGLAKALMEKNLVSFEGDSADAFLRRCHVKNGLKGLNYINTTFLTDVNQSEINLIVSYQINVVRLLGNDYSFNFVQRATTTAWGGGVSLKENKTTAAATKTIWDASNLSRGNSIITSEKHKFSYTSASYDFHAYDSSNNQFIRIRSINTFDKTYYNDSKAIEDEIEESYNRLDKGVSVLDEKITMQNSTGNDTVVTSNPDTRTYKVIIVVPDSADMTVINTAISNFQAEHPGVQVEVKTGYGNPSDAQTTTTSESTETTETQQ